MSKLSQNLKAYNTGNRYEKPPKIDYTSFGSSSLVTGYQIEYKLDCVFRSGFIVDAGDVQALGNAISKSKRAILEEIFGEFRQELYNLDMALYNQDYQKAKDILDGVLKNMFDY